MFMIFHLHRKNVLAIGDLGIRNGLTEFHVMPKKSLEGSKQQRTIKELCAVWGPYSSVGCCLMWKLADEKKRGGTVMPSVPRSCE